MVNTFGTTIKLKHLHGILKQFIEITELHVRAKLLSQIVRTDIKIAAEKLLTSLDIPLLDRKGLQSYKIYPFPVYQNISENYTRAVYILPQEK